MQSVLRGHAAVLAKRASIARWLPGNSSRLAVINRSRSLRAWRTSPAGSSHRRSAGRSHCRSADHRADSGEAHEPTGKGLAPTHVLRDDDACAGRSGGDRCRHSGRRRSTPSVQGERHGVPSDPPPLPSALALGVSQQISPSRSGTGDFTPASSLGMAVTLRCRADWLTWSWFGLLPSGV